MKIQVAKWGTPKKKKLKKRHHITCYNSVKYFFKNFNKSVSMLGYDEVIFTMKLFKVMI